jgi:hypothetical protein
MKFQLQTLLSKHLFEFTWGQNLIHIGNLFIRFMFLQPRMVRQIGPGQFEEVEHQSTRTGHFYV